MADNRVKEFLNTFSIYAIGTIGAKLIAFALVPLYTFFLAKDDMGYFDLVITLIMLLVPFCTFDLRDGAFRFLIDKNSDTPYKDVLTFIVRTLTRNSVAIIILSAIGYYYLSHHAYYPVIVLTLIAYSCYEVMIQVVRGLGHTKLFVALGVVNTLLILVLSLLFLIVLHWGVLSIFLANLISRVLTLIYIEYRLHIISLAIAHRKEYNPQVGKDLLRYTLPLLPNVLAWWAIESSSKLFINHFLGLEANGIFAVAIKFSNIMQIAAGIFYQAWQETAIKQMHAADHDRFFSRIFNNYFFLLSMVVVLATLALKLLYPYIVSDAYQESFIYVFPLLVAVLLHAMGSFLDLAYQCSRKTTRGLPSILSTAALAIVLYAVTVGRWGLMGITLSLVVAYAYLMVYRLFDVRFVFRIVPDRMFLLSLLLLIAGGYLAYCNMHPAVTIAIIAVGATATGLYAMKNITKRR